jgi:uncharacterized membrane protein YdjX (TVP38/TMEM64 family)
MSSTSQISLAKRNHRRTVRIVGISLLVAAFVTTAFIVYRRGGITAKEVAAWLDSLGAMAPVLFSVVFVVGLMIGLPGMVFVIGARLAFGPWLGFALAYGVGLVGMMLPFAIGRALRSDSHWQPKNKWLAKLVLMIERRPIAAVVLLRIVLWFNSPVAYALAASRLRWRDYIIGCVVALAPVVLLAFLATGWFL